MKECPFCTHRAPELNMEERGRSFGMSYRVVCPKCGGAGPWADSKEAAVFAWDTRFRELCEILPTGSKVIKQCGACGNFFSDLGYHWLARIEYCPVCGARVEWSPMRKEVQHAEG